MNDIFIGLLGPLEVRTASQDVRIAGTKQRLLLAALALRSNQVVDTEELIQRLWDDNPPPSARITVRNYVKRLRGEFAACRKSRPLIESASGGYRLSIEGDCIDLDRFRRLRRDAVASQDLLRESALLNDALGLWRDRPLSGLGMSNWVDDVVLTLEEELLQAAERRCELAIERGEPGEASIESQRLVARHPFRESMWQRLILSLHRGGRNAEALNRYDELRRLLADQLGVEPSGPLRNLYQKILAD